MKERNIKSLLLLIIGISFLYQCQSVVSDQEKLTAYFNQMENYNELQDSIRDSGWESLSQEGIQTKLDILKSWKQDLEAINVSNLTESQQINYDLANYVLDNDIYILESKIYENPLNSEGGFLTDLFYSIQGINADTEEKRENYIKKIKALPQYLDDHMELMKSGMASGRMAPKVVTQNCINLLESQLTAPAEQSVYFIPASKLDDEEFNLECLKAINGKAVPALQQYHKFLVSTYLPAAPEEIGVSSWPQGKEYYEQRIKYFTTLDISPDDVYKTGESEVSRIKAEMETIIDEVNYKGSFSEFLTFLRTDTQFYSKTPEDLLEKASRIAKKMEAQMPKLFGKLPRMPFTVTPVPDALAPNYTGGRYSPGSYSFNRAGEYWVNTYKLENRPLYVLPALTLHEAVPGHHHQIMLAQEIEDVPKLRRNTYLSSFGEGWGLYSEFLGVEAGIYATPYENFGRLTYEMWRACRLVVDVGMHYKGWTRDQAVEYMASNTALSLHEVNTEIDRYIGWPGQAVSYKIGELKIKELRKKAEDALGENFNIRDFHDNILMNGSILMSSLEKVIDNYIRDSKSEYLDN
jgi:uncharacterized protein (DUF885 family)